MSKIKVKDKIKDIKSVIIIVLLVSVVLTNFWLTYSVMYMHNVTVQFIQDAFYGYQEGEEKTVEFPNDVEEQHNHEYEENSESGYSQHEDHYHDTNGDILNEEEYNKILDVTP